jgi:AAA family ATP:ADP antiporter
VSLAPAATLQRSDLRPSALERVLHLFTDVRSGEGATALAMTANVFLILCAYYFIKPLRDGWIATSEIAGVSKMEVKAYTSFAQGIVLIGVVSLYARLAARWPRRDLIVRSTLFCMTNLVGFWLLRPDVVGDRLPGVGIVFYIWVGMFGVFVVSQFWAFAADLYHDDPGRRLLPMIAIGATAGAVMGSFLTEHLLSLGLLDSGSLLLAANVPLAGSIILTTLADRREAGRDQHAAGGPAAPPCPATPGHQGGILHLVLHHRFLLAVAAVTLFTAWVSTNGENLMFQVVQEALGSELTARGVTDAQETRVFVREGTTVFYGSFFFWVNVCALLLQAFVASRLLSYGGFACIFLLLPVLSLLTYSAMAMLPTLLVVRVMKTAENATAYSINNTARHVLWLPTTAAMKYTAKPAIETLFVRLGDGFAAATILIGVRIFSLATQSFFVFNLALVIGWLVGAAIVVRAHLRLTAGLPPLADR